MIYCVADGTLALAPDDQTLGSGECGSVGAALSAVTSESAGNTISRPPGISYQTPGRAATGRVGPAT